MALEKKKLWQDFLMYFLFWLHPGAAPRQQCNTFDFVVLFNFCLMFFNCFKKIEDEKIVTFLLWLDPGAAPGQQCSPGFSRRSLELSHFTFPKPATAVERTPNDTLLLLPAFSFYIFHFPFLHFPLLNLTFPILLFLYYISN